MEFQFQRALDELERAAEICSEPNVSGEERTAAESLILGFRKSKDAIDLCKFILERTRSEHLRFDTAQVLRDNLMAGWDRLSRTDIPTVLAQQLINLVFNSNISYAVGRRLATIVAIIVKHQAIERNGQERKELVHHLISAITTTGHAVVAATTVLESLIFEHQFVSGSMKTDHCFTFEAHFASKKNFENDELLLIFESCLQFLNSYNGGRENDFERIIRLVETILFWSFTNTNLPQRILVVIENDVSPVFKPPMSWERVVNNSAFENIFFDLQLKVRGNEALVARTLQFLNQIFSMSGPLFSGRSARVGLLARLLPRFIQLLELPNKSGREILGLSEIVRKVLLFHRMATLNSIDADLLEKFFCVAGAFTCGVLQQTAVEESQRNVEDRVLRESSTRLLEAWTNVLAEPEDVPNCVLPISNSAFGIYVHGKLSPPLGYRPPISLEEEDEEEELMADDVRFRDQLQPIGLFGRFVVKEAIDLLNTVLTQLILRFQTLVAGGGGSPAELYEDLHWVLLIAGHFLAYESEGETNLIPKEIVQFSLKSAADPNLSAVCIEKVLSLQSPPDGNLDPVIKLISLVLFLSEFERSLIDAGLSQFLSPEVSKNVVWFLSRVAGVYFLYPEAQYAEMSVAFRDVFGKNSRVGGILLDSLLIRVRNHLSIGGEDAVQVEAVELLASLTNSEDKARRALTSSQFAPLVQLINSVGPNKRDLPCEIYKRAVKSLMVVGNHSATEYWDQILNPLCLRFVNFTNIPPSDKHREDVKLELTFLLSGYIGIVSSANSRVALDLFQRLVPLRRNISSILSLYYHYTDLVQLCLTFMTELGKRFLSYLAVEHALEVYHEAINVTKAYALHAYGRVSAEKGAEDDKVQDLVLLFSMMISLLTKDLLDLSPDVTEDRRGPPSVTGTSVAIICLSIVLPLLSKDLFEYPTLSDKYFRLISYLGELDPGVLLTLEVPIFNQLMETVSLALKTSNPDSFNHCCEFITCLTNHISRNNLQGSDASELVKAFLRVFFHMALTMTISKDSLPSISSVVFALISAYKEAYEEIAREIITAAAKRQEELQIAFQELTGGNINMVAGGDRQSRMTFRLRFEHFIHTIRSNIDT